MSTIYPFHSFIFLFHFKFRRSQLYRPNNDIAHLNASNLRFVSGAIQLPSRRRFAMFNPFQPKSNVRREWQNEAFAKQKLKQRNIKEVLTPLFCFNFRLLEASFTLLSLPSYTRLIVLIFIFIREKANHRERDILARFPRAFTRVK